MALEKPQLVSAKRLLKEAFALVADVQGIFHGRGDTATAARLKAVGERLRREIERAEQLLVGPEA